MESIDRISFDRGLHLRGTPLWFDASRKRELCVLTHLPARTPPPHKRVVSTPGMAEVLRRSGYKTQVLPAPARRWFAVSGHRIQVHPQGADAFTPAAVVVMDGNERVCITGPLLAGAHSLPRVRHLVVGLPAPGHRGGGMPSVLRGLQLFLRSVTKATIVTEAFEVGALLINQLSALGIDVVARGRLHKLWGGAKSGSVSVALSDTRLSQRAQIALVDCGLGLLRATASRRPKAATTLRLHWYAGWSDLQSIVSSTGAAKLSVFGLPRGSVGSLKRQISVPSRILDPARQLAWT